MFRLTRGTAKDDAPRTVRPGPRAKARSVHGDILQKLGDGGYAMAAAAVSFGGDEQGTRARAAISAVRAMWDSPDPVSTRNLFRAYSIFAKKADYLTALPAGRALCIAHPALLLSQEKLDDAHDTSVGLYNECLRLSKESLLQHYAGCAAVLKEADDELELEAKYETAATCLKKALEIANWTGLDEDIAMLVSIELKRGNRDEALKLAKKYAKHNPEHAPALRLRAALLMEYCPDEKNEILKMFLGMAMRDPFDREALDYVLQYGIVDGTAVDDGVLPCLLLHAENAPEDDWKVWARLFAVSMTVDASETSAFEHCSSDDWTRVNFTASEAIKGNFRVLAARALFLVKTRGKSSKISKEWILMAVYAHDKSKNHRSFPEYVRTYEDLYDIVGPGLDALYGMRPTRTVRPAPPPPKRRNLPRKAKNGSQQSQS